MHDLVVQFARLWGQKEAVAVFENNEAFLELMKSYDSEELAGLLTQWADAFMDMDELDDTVDFFEVQINQLYQESSLGNALAGAEARSEESRMGKIKIEILQVKDGDDARFFRFSHLGWLKDGVHSVVPENYQKVYELSLKPVYDLNNETSVMDLLEQVYTTFNMNHPEDYRGRSMSVSDVIVLETAKARKAYYCDTVGFEPLPTSFVEGWKAAEKTADADMLRD